MLSASYASRFSSSRFGTRAYSRDDQAAPAYAPQPPQQQPRQKLRLCRPRAERAGGGASYEPTPEAPYVGYVPYAPVALKELKPPPDRLSSVYIPVDSWMYPELTRLYGMGFLDTMFLGMRPYTRRSVLHMLQKSEDAILSSDNNRRRTFWQRTVQIERGGSGRQRSSRFGVRCGLLVYAVFGDRRPDSAGQLPSGADDQQRLRTTV